jgi:hypothetical protein
LVEHAPRRLAGQVFGVRRYAGVGGEVGDVGER